MKKYFIRIPFSVLLIAYLSAMFSSCKKFVEVPVPSNALNGSSVFSSDATAAATINGLYVNMSDAPYLQGRSGISLLTGLSSDELALYSAYSEGTLTPYFQNNLSSQFSIESWNNYYNYLHTINSVLEGLSKSNIITEKVKKQLEGEAKFLRAFLYFYLVNLYGDVPLVLTSDWKTNSAASRTAKDQVWKQVIKDLIDAQNLLSDKYLMGDAKTAYSAGVEERVRPTKWAATALLSRCYLFINDWVNAEIQATTVINNKVMYDTVSLNNVFLKNSKEAIWQLMNVKPGVSNLEAPFYMVPFFGFSNNFPVHLSSFLLNSFEQNDKRKANGNWINSITISGSTYYYPFKYKQRSLTSNPTPTEYFTLFRLAEQYLIRAEAAVQQNKISVAQADLNIIRNRAGLSNVTTSNKDSLLAAILQERKVELFIEGHRWFDLKRTGNIDAVMTAITPAKANGNQWESYKQYWPIFYRDIQLNPNLSQTPGY